VAEPDRAEFEEAERLVREAQRAAEEAVAGAVPPRGWRAPGDDRPAPFPDLAQLTALIESLRGVVPPDLARQLADALRELLIALRAVLDYSIERLEPGEAPSVEVEDIPIQ
jgi:hypothetical protein